MVWFGLSWFYGLSTIVAHLMPNSVYTYITNTYEFVLFGLVSWHIHGGVWFCFVWFDFMAYQLLLRILCQILFIHIY